MRYFTSDTHYGHENIIRFCGRPYSDVREMNADLVRRAACVLGAGDDLWHLGDVALGRLDNILLHLSEMASDVTLVAGNHDRCHPSNGARSERFVEVYRERCGPRELILTNTRLVLANGEQVQVSHFPYAETDPEQGRAGELDSPIDKFAPWRPTDDGSWLLCGHVHEKWRQRGRMINVGVDAWGGTPVSESAICSLMATGPRDLPPLPWR
jgi:calcineurin-like phosphoesterase family protein